MARGQGIGRWQGRGEGRQGPKHPGQVASAWLTVVHRKRSADRPYWRETGDSLDRAPGCLNALWMAAGHPRTILPRAAHHKAAPPKPRSGGPHGELHTPTHQANVPARAACTQLNQGWHALCLSVAQEACPIKKTRTSDGTLLPQAGPTTGVPDRTNQRETQNDV